MNCKFIFLFLTAFSLQLHNGETAKILALFTSGGKSHTIIHMAVARALIERGHNLTIVTPLELNEPNHKFDYIKLPYKKNNRAAVTDMAKMSYLEKMANFFNVFPMMMNHSANSLKSPEFQQLLEKENSFDLVLYGYFFNDFELGVSAHYKCPSVINFMVQPMFGLNKLIGNHNELNSATNTWMGYREKLTFFDRVKSYLYAAFDYAVYLHLEKYNQLFYNELFPSNKYPSLDEARKNVSLVLANHHFTQGPIKANVPAAIEIGGIAIEENPKPLPKDIKEHLDNAKDGAIFFSMGSNAHSSDLGENNTATIFKVFSQLKQNIIWKWEDEILPGKSKNILYSKWVPQSGVLAHPNTKIFITHGGKGSILESQYYGVPMIGLPLFAEQPANVASFVEQGYGLGLDHQKLTEEQFRSTIHEVLNNKKYEEKIKLFKKVFRDRPMTPKETVVYWVEYVLRHNGAKHMQSQAVHMNTIQLLGLDVFAFFAVVIYLVYSIFKFIFKFFWRTCCSCFGKNNEKTKSKAQNKKKNQ